jgi:DNA-binding PadR family transcriptional regulator
MDNATRALGGFEHQVLLTLLRLGGTTYTVPLVAEMHRLTEREPSAAAVYTTLRRLEARGLVSSAYEVPDETGRRVRLFTIEAEGTRVLRASREVLERLWRDVEGLDPA